MYFLFQVRINLNEKNDVAAIKTYLTTNLEANGPEHKRWRGPGGPRKNAKHAFEEINRIIRKNAFGNRPNIPNICFLLVNEEKTSRHLKQSGLNKLCDHTFVFSGKDEFQLATIQKKICPEAQAVRGMCDWFIYSLIDFFY